MSQIDAVNEATLDPKKVVNEPVEEVEDEGSSEEDSDQGELSVEDLQQKLEEAQAEATKYRRMAERKAKQAKTGKVPSKQNQTDVLDYGQKAYLQQNEIGEEYHDFVLEEMQNSGMELSELLKNGYFKSRLQDQMDRNETAKATPKGTRSGQTQPANTTVEFWLAKGIGALPPDTPENRQLRQDIVNARLKSDNPFAK